MVNGVLHTRVKFFEVNTQGRILNRFSNDMDTLDQLIFVFIEMIDVISILNKIPFIVYCEVHNHLNCDNPVMSLGSHICDYIYVLSEKA